MSAHMTLGEISVFVMECSGAVFCRSGFVTLRETFEVLEC